LKDNWLGENKLKDKYPRIFANSNQKEAMVVDVEEHIQNRWEWSISWKRNLFEWEKPIVEKFIQQIQSKKIKRKIYFLSIKVHAYGNEKKNFNIM